MPKIGVRNIEISPDQSGRRLDNYLTGILKNVPKSFIYRIIRRGEVRVNGSRSRPNTRLNAADIVRIPPLSTTDSAAPIIGAEKIALIERSVVFENDALLVLNKPSGLAVHGGSGLQYGVIDIVRRLRPNDPGIELAHRLDRETSGCLVFAKNYPILRLIQRHLASHGSHKTYLSLLRGELATTLTTVKFKLTSIHVGSEKHTVVAHDGKNALTEFTLIEILGGMSLARVEIATGRTHQIRVHASAVGYPVAGDRKYGDSATNSELRRLGLRRMFLHATSIALPPGIGQRPMLIEAPLPRDLASILSKLRCPIPT